MPGKLYIRPASTPVSKKPPAGSGGQRIREAAKTFGAFCVLLDDGIHQRIVRTAERIEKRTGCSRKTLVYHTLGAGIFTTLSFDTMADTSGWSMASGIIITTSFAFLYGGMASNAIDIQRIADRRGAISPRTKGLTIARFPMAVWAIFNAIDGIVERAADRIGSGSLYASWAVVLYLASSTGGLVDWARERFAALKPAAVPGPVR